MVTSIVLTGGKSSRLGKDKALEGIGGKSLIQLVVQRLTLISNQILIVGSSYQFDFPVNCSLEYREDLHPGKGPLGGIYTGLVVSKSFYNLVVACDMPFLNVELLRYIIKLSPGFDAVIPRVGRIQPLHAVYCKSCLDDMRKCLENNQLKIAYFLNTINVKYLEQSECQRFDPALLSFFNINFPADLDYASMLSDRER